MSGAPLRSRLEARGAAFGEIAGHPVARHFGDGEAEYHAVRDAAGVADRSDLAVIRMWGRDPVKMLNGLITNDLGRAAPGQGVYAALLTPKGRMIADLRAFRRETEGGTEVLAVVPREALAGAAEHLKKYVPPLFARWEDASDSIGVLGVYGPKAAGALESALGVEMRGAAEDAFREVAHGDASLLIAATRYLGREEGFDIIAPVAVVPELWDTLLRDGLGTRPIGFGAQETLRIEAGYPRYGADLTDETIPTEAYESTGLLSRAVSFTKGCYTGQEVIIRIAHRGHVNRHLRGLLLGDAPATAPRTPLFHPDSGKEIGWTTSSAVSPRLRQTVALGYVRREVVPGGAVRLGGVDGPEVPVVRLPFAPPGAPTTLDPRPS